MWTKRELVTEAYRELAIAGIEFDLSPEAFDSGLVRMDAMIASWQPRGIALSYPLPATRDASDLDEPSGIPDWANEAVFLNLAIRLAASYGKTLSPETKALASQAYDQLLTAAAMPRRTLRPSMPRGAGFKRGACGPVWTAQPDLSPVRTDDAGQLDLQP